MIDRLFHTLVLVAVAGLVVLAAGGVGGPAAPSDVLRSTSATPTPTVTLERVVIEAPRAADGRTLAANEAVEPATRVAR